MSFPVKVCGITREEDARAACECGAQALGFNFYRPSPRYIEPGRAGEIIAGLPPFTVAVGVFVGEGAAEINRIARVAGLDRIQLHGNEPAELLAELERPGYRAFRLREEGDVAAIERTQEKTVLLDTYDPGLYGGTGRPFNWEWARKLGEGRRVILAGGLNPANAALALETARPAAVDVSSGVESAPGIKDPAALAAFFQAVSGHVFPTPSPWSADHASAE